MAFIIGVLVTVLVFDCRAAYAAGNCTEPDQPGCLELGVSIYQSSKQELIVALTSGEQESGDVATRLVSLRESETAGVNLDSGSYNVRMFIWNARNVPVESLLIYESNGDGTFRSRPATKASHLEWPEFAGVASFAIVARAAHGQFSLQVPYAMIGPTTEVLICVDADLAYPRKNKGQSGLGLRVANSLRNYVEKEWDTMPIALVAAE